MTDSAKPNYAARGRRKEETRQRILAEAADLFYRRGITAVSMDDAAASAGVSKPTLYAHFKTKEALVAEALSAVDEKHFKWFETHVQDLVSTGTDPVLALFDVLNHWFHSAAFRGCAFINASVEVGSSIPPAQIAVLRHKKRTREWLRDLAGASGVLHDQRGRLVAQLMILMEGAIITAFVEGDDQAATHAREVANTLLTTARLARPEQEVPEKPQTSSGYGNDDESQAASL